MGGERFIDRAFLDRWRIVLCSEKGPPPTTRLLLLALAEDRTYVLHGRAPTRAELVKLSGLSRRSVIRHLQIGEALGWIERPTGSTGGDRLHLRIPGEDPSNGPHFDGFGGRLASRTRGRDFGAHACLGVARAVRSEVPPRLLDTLANLPIVAAFEAEFIERLSAFDADPSDETRARLQSGANRLAVAWAEAGRQYRSMPPESL